jgi:hypothetical protein
LSNSGHEKARARLALKKIGRKNRGSVIPNGAAVAEGSWSAELVALITPLSGIGIGVALGRVVIEF